MNLNLSSSQPNLVENNVYQNDSNKSQSLLLNNKSEEMYNHLSFEIAVEDKIIYGFLVALGLLIIAANLQILILVIKSKFLRKKTNYIIISLAVSDLLSGALAIPLLIACNSAPEYSLSVCVGMDVCQRFLAISTILHLAMAVLNRYFRIVRPFQYRQVVTSFRLGLLISSLWIISLTAALVQTSWLLHQNATKTSLIYDVVVLGVLVLPPFLIIIAACVRMFGVIKQRKNYGSERFRQRNFKQSQRKAFIVYSIIATCFAIGWFPYFMLTITEDLEVQIELPYWLTIVFLFLKFGTSLADPLLYTLLKTDFQKALKYVLHRKTSKSKLHTSLRESQYYLRTERTNR